MNSMKKLFTKLLLLMISLTTILGFSIDTYKVPENDNIGLETTSAPLVNTTANVDVKTPNFTHLSYEGGYLNGDEHNAYNYKFKVNAENLRTDMKYNLNFMYQYTYNDAMGERHYEEYFIDTFYYNYVSHIDSTLHISNQIYQPEVKEGEHLYQVRMKVELREANSGFCADTIFFNFDGHMNTRPEDSTSHNAYFGVWDDPYHQSYAPYLEHYDFGYQVMPERGGDSKRITYYLKLTVDQPWLLYPDFSGGAKMVYKLGSENPAFGILVFDHVAYYNNDEIIYYSSIAASEEPTNWNEGKLCIGSPAINWSTSENHYYWGLYELSYQSEIYKYFIPPVVTIFDVLEVGADSIKADMNLYSYYGSEDINELDFYLYDLNGNEYTFNLNDYNSQTKHTFTIGNLPENTTFTSAKIGLEYNDQTNNYYPYGHNFWVEIPNELFVPFTTKDFIKQESYVIDNIKEIIFNFDNNIGTVKRILIEDSQSGAIYYDGAFVEDYIMYLSSNSDTTLKVTMFNENGETIHSESFNV